MGSEVHSAISWALTIEKTLPLTWGAGNVF
jgi:hypothetical protein